MAADSEDQEASQEQSVAESTSHDGDTAGDNAEAESRDGDEDDEEEEEGEEGEEGEEEGEEEEPKLKYARMTSHLVPVYRNGDMTSAFLVAGDKMVLLGSSELLTSTNGL
jgi:hypothetical protein